MMQFTAIEKQLSNLCKSIVAGDKTSTVKLVLLFYLSNTGYDTVSLLIQAYMFIPLLITDKYTYS